MRVLDAARALGHLDGLDGRRARIPRRRPSQRRAVLRATAAATRWGKPPRRLDVRIAHVAGEQYMCVRVHVGEQYM
eukprot:7382901-Prymnesium_polylepis.1